MDTGIISFSSKGVSQGGSALDVEWLLAVVKQHDADVTAVVGIDHTCSDTDVRLEWET